jgi:hypothetical protein
MPPSPPIVTPDGDNGRTEHGLTRRGFLAGAVSTTLAGAAGVAVGYRERARLRGQWVSWNVSPLQVPDAMTSFGQRAVEIRRLRHGFDATHDAEVRARYDRPILGRFPIWDLFVELGRCVDPTDESLFCASQLVHVEQLLAAMEANGLRDTDILVATMLHDLGKLLLLVGADPADVVGPRIVLEEAEAGAGLAHVRSLFGHAEFIGERLRDRLPEHVAWLIGNHNVRWTKEASSFSQRDRAWVERYLIPFRSFDGQFGSPFFLPSLDMAPYRELLERYLPDPIEI